MTFTRRTSCPLAELHRTQVWVARQILPRPMLRTMECPARPVPCPLLLPLLRRLLLSTTTTNIKCTIPLPTTCSIIRLRAVPPGTRAPQPRLPTHLPYTLHQCCRASQERPLRTTSHCRRPEITSPRERAIITLPDSCPRRPTVQWLPWDRTRVTATMGTRPVRQRMSWRRITSWPLSPRTICTRIGRRLPVLLCHKLRRWGRARLLRHRLCRHQRTCTGTDRPPGSWDWLPTTIHMRITRTWIQWRPLLITSRTLDSTRIRGTVWDTSSSIRGGIKGGRESGKKGVWGVYKVVWMWMLIILWI